jgi:hypothetical protein
LSAIDDISVASDLGNPGRSVGIRTIGYANKPGKDARLTAASASAVVASVADLVLPYAQTVRRAVRTFLRPQVRGTQASEHLLLQ